MTLLRRTFGAVALAAPLLLTVTTPAVAHPLTHVDAAVVQGSGVISPSLGLLYETHSIYFNGTATVLGTDGELTTWDCSFAGSSLASLAHGMGSVSGWCGPLLFELCVFVRVAAVVLVDCLALGEHAGTAPGVCAFLPHDTLPTTSYDLLCGFGVAFDDSPLSLR